MVEYLPNSSTGTTPGTGQVPVVPVPVPGPVPAPVPVPHGGAWAEPAPAEVLRRRGRDAEDRQTAITIYKPSHQRPNRRKPNETASRNAAQRGALRMFLDALMEGKRARACGLRNLSRQPRVHGRPTKSKPPQMRG